MNGVGDIERTEVSLRRLPCNLSIVVAAGIYTDVDTCARARARARAGYLAKGTRTKIDSIIVAEADERAIGRSINSGTDDGRL